MFDKLCQTCKKVRSIKRFPVKSGRVLGVCDICYGINPDEVVLRHNITAYLMGESYLPVEDDCGGGGCRDRRCLRCDKFFRSAGKGNRICPECSSVDRQLDTTFVFGECYETPL